MTKLTGEPLPKGIVCVCQVVRVRVSVRVSVSVSVSVRVSSPQRYRLCLSSSFFKNNNITIIIIK